MILIPELETVVILVPRTGSSTLRRAIADKYSKSVMLYRHMEADGVPAGYDRWRKVGVVRHPVERLWSLYKFVQGKWGRGQDTLQTETGAAAAMLKSVQLPFSNWLLDNDVCFIRQHGWPPNGKTWPVLSVLHALPENRKSQFIYLRPDLGTKVFKYTDLHLLGGLLGVSLTDHQNQTAPSPVPKLSMEASEYVDNVFAWDFGAIL